MAIEIDGYNPDRPFPRIPDPLPHLDRLVNQAGYRSIYETQPLPIVPSGPDQEFRQLLRDRALHPEDFLPPERPPFLVNRESTLFFGVIAAFGPIYLGFTKLMTDHVFINANPSEDFQKAVVAISLGCLAVGGIGLARELRESFLQRWEWDDTAAEED